MTRKHRKDGLVSKVSKVPRSVIQKDFDNKRYIPLCNLSWHTGIIRDESVCLLRGCSHYNRGYIDSHNDMNKYLSGGR